MLNALRQNWKIYLIEAWALGMFMVSACFFTILLEHPMSSLHQIISDKMARHVLSGIAMGVTAILLIYSPWGKRSGAHMNPAITMANLQMERITKENAAWYIIAQFAGGATAVYLFKLIVPGLIMAPTVNYAVTQPGIDGPVAAFAGEFIAAFALLILVLICSNSRYAKYTGLLAGFMVAFLIIVEGNYSGMSINPARTLASALPGMNWNYWWIYFTSPVAAMLLAGFLYRKIYRASHNGNCLSMKCHMSGNPHNCATYEVLGPSELMPDNPTLQAVI